jgi:D-alanyl-D-alanine carboxypeptidase (penicillin-binding protein 5/6)
MGAPSRDIRNAAATSLLDWGFANHALDTHEAQVIPPLRVCGGVREMCPLSAPDFSAVVPRAKKGQIEVKMELPERLEAPVEQGTEVGKIIYSLDGNEIGSVSIVAQESIPRIGFWGLVARILGVMSFA